MLVGIQPRVKSTLKNDRSDFTHGVVSPECSGEASWQARSARSPRDARGLCASQIAVFVNRPGFAARREIDLAGAVP